MKKHEEQLANEGSCSGVPNKGKEDELIELPSAEAGNVVVGFPPEASGPSQIGPEKIDVGIPQRVVQILHAIEGQNDRVTQLKSVIEKEKQRLIQLQEIFKTLTNVEWKPGITLEQLDFTRVPVTEETPTIASGLRRKKKKKKKKKKVDLATETPMPISGIQCRDISNPKSYQLVEELKKKGQDKMKVYSFEITSQIKTFRLNCTIETSYPIYLSEIPDQVNEKGLFTWFSEYGVIYELSFYINHKTLLPNKLAKIAYCYKEERDVAFICAQKGLMLVSKDPPSSFLSLNEKLRCLNENSFCSCVPPLYSELEIILNIIADMKNRIEADNLSKVYQSYLKMHAEHSFMLDQGSGSAENVINAANFIDSVSFSEFNQNVLFRLYGILSGGARIQYRTEIVMISTVYYQYVRTTSPENINGEMLSIIQQIKDLECDDSFVNRVIKTATIKYKLLKVHPFLDYNGRLSRILYCWALRRINPNIPFIIFPGNKKMEYNESLYSAQDWNDPYLWYVYAQKCIKKTLLQLESYLKCECSSRT